MSVTTFIRRSLVAAGVLSTLGGCDQLSTHLPGGVSDLAKDKLTDAAMSPEMVDRVGSWAVPVWLKTKKVVSGGAANQIAQEVMQKVIAAAKRSDYATVAENLHWKITVVDDPDINAVAVPGGNVIVNTGLTRFAQGQEQVVAVALTHEVVHALARDAATRMSKELKDTVVATFTGVDMAKGGLSPGATAGVMSAMGLAYAGAEVVPFARDQETRADHVGLWLMALAKYDPHATVKFWKDRGKLSKSHIPGFLQMHPGDETRIANLQEWMPEAVKLLSQAPAPGARG